MNSTTEGLSTRSRQADQDPAAVWGPLTSLADAAARTASDSTTVAINRGFDRKARERARALRQLLNERGANAVEITPAPDSEELLTGTEVNSVVNLVGTGSWQPYRLAAKKRAALLAPSPEESEPGESARRDVIGMTRQDSSRDAALTRVVVLPETTDESSITLTRDGETLSIPGGQVTITLHEGRMDIRLQGPDYAEQRFEAERLSVETHGGAHRLIRDEMPVAEFEGSLDFSCEQDGLVVHSV
ncbi:hypothetical protein FHR84_002973 [Actinopolyspora biskrensis]|uniref:Uncharacterized protein n=1 Tax=Actinopolyspora biskrensis TaxID=1470178 RepID=A0A852Z2Z8_9ACTN|nr:hypothetical protein [Actinopolyspora biskrensis]NYH79635.1 hypothetical protein [Actinopolyspora biskrensis]